MTDPSSALTPVQTTGVGRAQTLRQLAGLFLRLGLTAFGGPAAHVALMEDEVVVRRRWFTREQFLDMVGAANLIPGPSSTETAIFIGYLRAGVPGLVLGGVCFILPAAVLVGVLAWIYVAYGRLPQVAGVLYGVKPVVIAVIVQAIWRLGRTALKSPLLWVTAAAAAGLTLLGVNILLVLVFAGVLAAVGRYLGGRPASGTLPGVLIATMPTTATAPAKLATGAAGAALTPGAGGAAVAAGAVALAAPIGLWPLFLVFLKVGAVLFGSGYVLLAFLHADLVVQRHWLTEPKLLDAIAVGQVTPGPVFTTATFIGYVLGGPWGAAVATVAIFLPGFVYVALSGLVLPHIRKSPTAGAVLDGVNAGSLALMAVVTWDLGRAALVDRLTIALAVISAALLLRYKINATWLVLGGAVVGLGAMLLRH